MQKIDIVRLKDGSRVEFMECGNPGGMPVIGMHGYINSAYGVATPADQHGEKHGVRFIVPNRPGVGASRSKGVRMTKAQRVQDTLGLADELGIEKFGVFGVSAGAADALATASLAPERTRACTIVSGLAPIGHSRTLWQLRRPLPYLLRLAQLLPSLATAAILWLNLGLRCGNRDAWVQRLREILSPDDNILLQSSACADLLWNDHQEIFERGEGPFALMQEIRRMCFWGFHPEAVPRDVPILFLHGNEDTVVSEHMANGLARRIPRPNGSRLTPDIRPGGHLMILKDDNLHDAARWLRSTLEARM
jgi:pimeloyl-ACP methyl ester carboxylesterase